MCWGEEVPDKRDVVEPVESLKIGWAVLNVVEEVFVEIAVVEVGEA
jgi:hypothetical protein